MRVLSILAAALFVIPVLTASPAGAQQSGSDLVAQLRACGRCGQFLDLVQAAGLTDTLQGPGPLTVWAPTDAALSRLAPTTRQRLQQDRDALRSVVQYHLAPSVITAAQIVQVPSVRTVQGEPVQINAAGGGVRINDAPVVQADLIASNGIIHVIDGVLIPPSHVDRLPRTGIADAGLDTSTLLGALGLGLLLLGLSWRRLTHAQRPGPSLR